MKPVKVFISYSRKDAEFVNDLQQRIQNAGNIDITIDVKSLAFGDDLPDFVKRAVRDTDFTISVVSKHSLESVWVVEEFLETLNYEEFKEKKKLLPIYIDESLFDHKYELTLLKKIKENIYKLKEEADEILKLGGTTHRYDAQRDRLQELKPCIGKILSVLHSRLTADFSDELAITENFPKLLINIFNDKEYAEHTQEKKDRKLSAHEFIAPYNFDLQKLFNTCVECIFKKTGLIGFAVWYNSPTLLRNLCERLENNWDSLSEKTLKIEKSISIGPLHTPVHHALSIFEKRCCPRNNSQPEDRIIVVSANTSDAEEFWQSLYTRCSHKQHLEYRIVVIMALSEKCDVSDEIIELPQPEFTRGDVFTWVEEMLARLHWTSDRDIARTLKNIFSTDCCIDKTESSQGEFIIELVYDLLEEIKEALQQYRTPESFKNHYLDLR